jgi:uncharacterized protein YqjF (DUF2071 family)
MSATPIDRLGPTRRPDRCPVMRQSWRRLLFLHWEVPADRLQPRLPPGLTLDTFEGRAFVGLVPFTMRGVRPVSLPAVPLLSNFHETNVRTYVHIEGRDPGVWFFSLDAANPIAVLTARAWFHLPYHRARMDLTHDSTTDKTVYKGQRLWPRPLPAAYTVEAVAAGPARPAAPGTLEHFLAERYLLYAAHGDTLYRGQVHHRPYPLQPAEAVAVEETLLAAAGLERPRHAPLAHYARGVDVAVFRLERVR